MAQRLASNLALVAFAMCLLVGLQAGNTFATTVQRAILALAGTYVIGLAIGWVLRRMLAENLRAEEEKLRNSGEKLEINDR